MPHLFSVLFLAIVGMQFLKFIFSAEFVFLLFIIVIISSNLRYFSLVIISFGHWCTPTTQASSFKLYENS